MAKKAAQKKALPKAPIASAGAKKEVKKNYTFEKTPRSFRIGGDIQPKRDLTRFTKWPAFIRVQRQKRILLQRLKVPPTIAQFEHTLDKEQFKQLARFLKKLQPETRAQKKERLNAMAQAQKDGNAVDNKCPPALKFGLNHVTTLVEEKKAQLVIIAHDVDPVEIICWLPQLCRKMEVPYCIVKSKSRLGKLVNKKTASCLAVTTCKSEDKKDLETLKASMLAAFNDNKDAHRRWGGGLVGVKSMHVQRARQQLLEKEQAKKTGLLG
jgi:large subunit ribosomal protein L7Ae